MRRLMWFTLGLSATCAIDAYLGIPCPLTVSCLALVLAIVLFVLPVKRALLRPLALLMVGLAAGTGLFWGFDEWHLSAAREADGQIKAVTIRASDFARETAYGYAVEGTVTLADREYEICAYLNEIEEPLQLYPRDLIRGDFLLRMTVTGDNGTSYAGKGIFLLAYQRGEMTLTAGEADFWIEFPAMMHQSVLELIETLFPADSCAFAKALLLGDTIDLSYKTDTALKVSGIRHVVAVSGLHVSILFSAVYFLSGRRKVLTAVMGIPVLILFAAVVGFNASITRACIMQILVILALLFEREYDPPTALSFAVLIMLGQNPMCITDVGFQLSVGCMIGIFLFSGRVRGWMLSDKCLGEAKGKSIKARLKRAIAGSVSITLGAMTVTTPLCALYFGTVSLVGIVTNLLTLWIVTFIFVGIIIACLLGSVWLSLGTVVAWLISWGIRYVLLVAEILSKFPLSAVYTKSIYVTAWLIFCYVLLLLFLTMKKKRPAVFASCMIIGLCAALLVSWVEPLQDECRMTVLDVGQGQCILLQSKGRNFMVDCGGQGEKITADEAAETLLSQGVTHLDGMILTHYDTDHSAGAANLLTRVDADVVMVPDTEDTYGVADTILDVTSGEVLHISEQTTINLGGTVLTVFPAALTDSSNESSLCVLFQTEKCAILITGDRGGFGERMLLRNAQIPEVDVLIAGHHGSKDSVCEELLQAVDPDIVIVSVGADNPYGHPAKETIERLEEYGCEVYRTDLHGTIIYRR